jgi:hypothetical protein
MLQNHINELHDSQIFCHKSKRSLLMANLLATAFRCHLQAVGSVAPVFYPVKNFLNISSPCHIFMAIITNAYA